MGVAVEALGWTISVLVIAWLFRDRVQAVRRRGAGTKRADAWSYEEGGSALPDWAHAGIGIVAIALGFALIGLGQRM